MLSIKKMGRGSEDYYLDLADYYAEGDGEPAGRWLGRGCGALGLWGEVSREELKPLMLGQHPHSLRPLVQNANASNRVPGWDLTFSAPKGVSIAWSQADPVLRAKIEHAHTQAVAATISLAETELAYSRVGAGGTGCTPVFLVVASFRHSTSRNLDQQLHTHCLVLNTAIDAAGKTRSLYSKPFFVNRNLLGAYYRAELAQALRKLGFHLRKHERSFEVEGIPAKLLAATSTRRQEIVARLASQGRKGGAAAAVATLDTRSKKGEIPPLSQLFEQWQHHNHQFGLSDVNNILHPQKPQRPGTIQQAIDTAITGLAADKSHFSKTDLMTAALQAAPGLGLAPQAVLQATQNLVEQTILVCTTTLATTITKPSLEPISPVSPLVDLGMHGGQQRFSTPEILAEEQALLAAVDELKNRTGATVPDHVLDWAIEEQLREVTQKAKQAGKKPPIALTREQMAAVRHLAQDVLRTGSIRVLRGLAGTGKTEFVLAIVTRALEECGYRVVAATPTAKAGRILQRDTGLDVETVTKTLGDYELPGGCVLNHHLKQLVKAILGESTQALYRPQPIKLKPKDVLLVDEASMLSTRHMQMMLKLAVEQGATVLLTGDPKQLPPVGRGAPLLSLSERVGSVDLADIQRQQQAWSRQVAQHAANGEIGQALHLLAQHNAVRACDTVEEAMAGVVQKWADLKGARQPAKVAMIATTNRETESLNQMAQQYRLERGLMDTRRSVPIRDEDPERDMTYTAEVFPGDQVLITKNSRELKVANGMTATVINVNPITGAVSLSLHEGGIVVVPARSFPHLRLGYAVTTYKVQGDTLRDVVSLVTETQQSLPAFYVQTTRAKESTTIFTTKALWDPESQTPIAKSPLAEMLGKSPDLRLATDLQEIAAAGYDQNPALQPPLELGHRREPSRDLETTPPTALAGSISTPTLPPVEEAPAPVGDVSPVEYFVAMPAWELPVYEKLFPAKEPHAPPVTEASPSGTREKSSPDPAVMFPPPPPQKPRKKKKKKRPGAIGPTPDEVEVEEEEIVEPVPQVSDVSPPVLPDEFFLIPVPSVGQWLPVDPVIVGERTTLLPEDFLTNPRPPIGRQLPTRVRIPQQSPGQLNPPQKESMPAEQARNPAYRQRRRQEQCDALIASAAAECNVPPDQIEIISVREWEEESGDMLTLWIEITYRIRQYGPQDLLHAVAFPIPLG